MIIDAPFPFQGSPGKEKPWKGRQEWNDVGREKPFRVFPPNHFSSSSLMVNVNWNDTSRALAMFSKGLMTFVKLLSFLRLS